MSQSQQFDVVIVGGGMVGATLACALAKATLKIALIEKQPPQPFEPEQAHDLRVSALSLASQAILEHLGAWQGVTDRRYCPYQRMRVWENPALGDTLFDSRDIGYSELGHIVENRIVQLALWEQFPRYENLTVFSPAIIEDIECSAEVNQLRLASGELIEGKLLVAADGGSSAVREAAGIGVMAEEYAQQALVIYVKTAYPQTDITWQRFYPSGPRAFLPLAGPYASLVWYDSPEKIKQLQSLNDCDLMAEIMRGFPKELGQLEAIKGRASFPLKRQHALSYAKDGVVLIGDAAHMIHPLAGQGVNIGLLDAAELAGLLEEAVAKGEDFSSLWFLKDYERKRRHHNALMMTTMDMFYRVFSDEHKPLSLVRNLGLKAAQTLHPARKKAMKFAMGLEGPLPALAKQAG